MVKIAKRLTVAEVATRRAAAADVDLIVADEATVMRSRGFRPMTIGEFMHYLNGYITGEVFEGDVEIWFKAS